MITPVSPIKEPIERSLPPVMMTKPTPMEKMPSIATWRVVLRRFASPRKSGLEKAMTAHIATRAQNIPSSFLIDAFLGGAGGGVRGSAQAGGGGQGPWAAPAATPVISCMMF